MATVLIVDDHPIFRSGAATALSATEDFEVVGEVGTVSEAIEIIRDRQPDLILTDIRLEGDSNGVALAIQVRAEFPNIKIVVLTNYSHEPYIKAMMEAQVEGYLLKDVPPAEVIDSIRKVLDGKRVFSDPITQKLVKGYLGASKNDGNLPIESLTDRELELLQELVHGLSNGEIAEHLNVSLKTVQGYLTVIYGKMNVKTRSEAVFRAIQEGLVIVGE
ncbi:MAG: response regulator transcription factor [Chloroflexi bacterium]|nr:response regulator transcription factor [Chloroflexota bacterium]